MPFRVLLTPRAERVFRRLGRADRERVRAGLLGLENEPTRARSGLDVRPLRGTQRLYRLRVGPWRAVFGIDGGDVIVTDIFLRRKGYDV